MNAFQACMKRKLKGHRPSRAGFRAAAKACSGEHRSSRRRR